MLDMNGNFFLKAEHICNKYFNFFSSTSLFRYAQILFKASKTLTYEQFREFNVENVTK
jgi:hypothetical protein